MHTQSPDGYRRRRRRRAGSDSRAFRNADTVEVTCTQVAAALWRRVAPHVPPRITLTRTNENDDDDADGSASADASCERGLEGEWVACGVNPVLLFTRYGAGGHFSPHTDGNTVIDFNTRSLHSMLLYLNDCPDGGHTTLFAPPGGAAGDVKQLQRFRQDEAQRLRWPTDWCVQMRENRCGQFFASFRADARVCVCVCRVADAAPVVEGSALIFCQRIPHEGTPVGG
jgi:leukotriene-A4 hydrolase